MLFGRFLLGFVSYYKIFLDRTLTSQLLPILCREHFCSPFFFSGCRYEFSDIPASLHPPDFPFLTALRSAGAVLETLYFRMNVFLQRC